MHIDRKQFLAHLVAAPAWLAATGAGARPITSGARRGGGGDDPPSGGGGKGESLEQRVERVLREYDALGIHRTATEGDERCAHWLADEARRLGAQTELESMPFSRIDVAECFVEVGGRRIEGVPVFDASFTGPEGVSATLAPAAPGAATEIGCWLETVPDAAGGKAFLEHRRTTRQKGLVAVTGAAKWNLDPGLALLNAESYTEPFGPPVVQIASEHHDAIAAAAGKPVRLVASVKRSDVVAYNTLATFPGTDRSLAPVGVMTPRSGWWHCASERGCGIAVWLEILAAVAAAKPARTVSFVASTGHELGHYGLSHYLESRQQSIAGTRAWIHLGANFACSTRPAVIMQFSDQEMRTLALDALQRQGLKPERETPLGKEPIGEARNVSQGGRYISITGFNGRFHEPTDRYPEAVDLPKTIAFARAYVEMALALAAA
jgi:hypothetical protein